MNAKAFTGGLNRASRAFTRFGSRMSAAGSTLTRSLGAPLGALAGIAGKTAVDFEFAMSKVAAVSGSTAAEMKALENEAKRLGRTTAFSASEVASLQLELAKLGFNPGQIDAMDSSILALAQAFDNELGEVSEAVGGTLNAFGLTAKDTAKVADVMATAFGNSALDLGRFSESMSKVAPIARDAGLGLKDTTALLGIMASNQITGADAGTKLKIALTEIRTAGLDVNDTLKGIVDGSFDFDDATKLLGKRAQILAPIFSKNSEKLAEFRQKLEDSDGAALDAQATLDDTTQGALNRMKSAIEGLAISFGELLLPRIERMADLVGNLAARFTNLDTGTKNTILRFVSIATALGPAVFLFGKLTTGVGLLLKVFAVATGPVGLIVAAIAGAAYLIYTNWNALVLYFTEGPGTGFLNTILSGVNAFVGFVVKLFETIYNVVTYIWREFGDDITEFAVDALQFLTDQFQTLFSFLGNLFNAGTALLSGDFGSFLTFLADASLDVVIAVTRAFLNLFETLGRGIDALAEFLGFETNIGGFIDSAEKDVTSFFEGLKFNEEGQTAGEEVGAGILSGMAASFAGFSLSDFIGLNLSGGSGEAPSVELEGAGDVVPSFLDTGDGDAAVSAVKGLGEAFEEMKESAEDALDAVADGLAQIIVDGASADEVFRGIFNSLLKQLISIATGYLITAALSPVAPENVATAGTAGIAKAAAAPATVAALLSNLTAFRDGGAVLGPTLSLIGENPASRGEFVIPFERMGDFLGQVGIEGRETQISGRIQSGDIFLSNEATDRLLSRRRVI
jgi:hypothetical protein